MSRKVVIIGAGAAGLTCAKQLIKSGFKVSIFEKSRGLGGRMASRRIENGIFNHGASRIPNFRIYSNVPKGLKSILETAVKKNILIPQKNHLTSVGGMKTFTSYLSEGLEIEKNSEINTKELALRFIANQCGRLSRRMSEIGKLAIINFFKDKKIFKKNKNLNQYFINNQGSIYVSPFNTNRHTGYDVDLDVIEKINWTINPEILVDKFGTDVVISIDNLADQTDNIGQPKQTLEEKIQARILYNNSKVSSLAS